MGRRFGGLYMSGCSICRVTDGRAVIYHTIPAFEDPNFTSPAIQLFTSWTSNTITGCRLKGGGCRFPLCTHLFCLALPLIASHFSCFKSIRPSFHLFLSLRSLFSIICCYFLCSSLLCPPFMFFFIHLVWLFTVSFITLSPLLCCIVLLFIYLCYVYFSTLIFFKP